MEDKIKVKNKVNRDNNKKIIIISNKENNNNKTKTKEITIK